MMVFTLAKLYLTSAKKICKINRDAYANEHGSVANRKRF